MIAKGNAKTGEPTLQKGPKDQPCGRMNGLGKAGVAKSFNIKGAAPELQKGIKNGGERPDWIKIRT